MSSIIDFVVIIPIESFLGLVISQISISKSASKIIQSILGTKRTASERNTAFM
jgi:hypothetical protein